MTKEFSFPKHLLTPTKIFLSFLTLGGSPISPGTIASIFSIPIIFFFYKYLSITIFLLYILLIYTISVNLTKKIQERPYDQRWIVIDEFIGMCITLLPLFILHKFTFLFSLVGLILFRIFDITKPSIIRKIDDLETPSSVILDDVVAGIVSSIILFFITKIF